MATVARLIFNIYHEKSNECQKIIVKIDRGIDEGFTRQTDSITDVLEVAFKIEMLIRKILTLKWSAEHQISFKRSLRSISGGTRKMYRNS